MAKFSAVRRFRTNPVEYGIFATVTLLFAHSIYAFLYHDEVRFTALAPSNGVQQTEGRSLASIQPATLNLEMSCDKPTGSETTAPRLRLTGSLCGGTTQAPVKAAAITNTTNHYAATVFNEAATSKFSTEYIPLANGDNVIRVDFMRQDGKSETRTVTVTRR
jgi:hypothetical protein